MKSPVSEAAAALLSTLVYQPSACRTTCILPYCGICWSDELPDMRQLITLSEDDRHAIFRLFEIRLTLWRGGDLSPADEHLWNHARRHAPRYALFDRLAVSDADLRAQEQCEREVAEELAELLSHADSVRLFDNERRESSFEATFDLTKDQKRTEDDRDT